METALGLTPDGTIHLSEFVVINGTISPGSKGANVTEILEKLKDLGYISTRLPDTHDTYEKTI